MHNTANAPPSWIVVMLVCSVLLVLSGVLIIAWGIRLAVLNDRRQRLRTQAWQDAVSRLQSTNRVRKVVIANGNATEWRCTVNRRHGATECNGFHFSHDDL